jgi:tRNA(fMet)-specific endonuclease VapC
LPHLVDTSVAILMRDSNDLAPFLAELDPPVFLSAVSRVELENGVYREPSLAATRRAALDLILLNLPTLDFGGPEILAYRSIMMRVGFDRRKTLDRMIGATALAHDLALVTTNPADFRDIPGLDVIAWSPA